MHQFKDNLFYLWAQLYGDGKSAFFEEFVKEIQNFKQNNNIDAQEEEWYKDVTIYSLYVDLFNADFNGLMDKLDYLSELGVSCLWLLPVLDSPMRDAGFDIKNYQKIRTDIIGDTMLNGKDSFEVFLDKAKEKNIKVIFDIAINHTSEEHYWFQEAVKSKDNPYRDYYIWNKDSDKYKDARIIFYGIEESNWEKQGDEYFFHRFFDFQPDLNYRNPMVLIEMTRNFLYWLQKGVNGFRADAIPYLWKEEGTSCENLPNTHTIVKIFRTILDYVQPNTLLLAEACQPPKEVVKYFGNGDECHAGYHFPLMPQIYKALGSASKNPIIQVLDKSITPEIPSNSQWFTFLRCHDELSLELTYVSEQDRKYIHENYCKNPEWDFRLGQGISARLSELMDRNPRKIALAFSVMLTLPGTPIIYYGDEFGKLNDENYYKETIKLVGKDDTRFLVRGRIDWAQLEVELKDDKSYNAIVYKALKTQIKTRSKHKTFGRGDLHWIKTFDENNIEIDSILQFERNYKDEKLLMIHNLSDEKKQMLFDISKLKDKKDLLGQLIEIGPGNNSLFIDPYASYWLKII
ncbi:MAG: alpha-amylase family glycosyl hydrolase [Bacteroidales bacterium]